MVNVQPLGREAPVLKSYEDSKNPRFSGKKVFLTYSNFAKKIDGERLLELLNEKVGLEGKIRYYLIGEEFHKNGRKHFHVLLEFFEKIDTRDMKFFDFKYGKNRHPNIQAPRNFIKLVRYIKKDGSWISNYPNNAMPIFERLATARDKEEFYREYLYELGDRITSSTYLRALEKYWQAQYDFSEVNEVSGKMAMENYEKWKRERFK